jgi:hypothetical protein
MVICGLNDIAPKAAIPQSAIGRAYNGHLIRATRPYHHPALGEFPGSDGGDAHLAARRGQPQPQLPFHVELRGGEGRAPWL